MTEHRSFKRLVRARMAKTGESYTAARAMLLRGAEPEGAVEVRLATSDERIRQRTGRGWEEWFEILDEWGAAERSHRETGRWLAEQQSLHPLAWNARRSRRATSAREVCANRARRTTATRSRPPRRWECPSNGSTTQSSTRRSARWLPDGQLSERTATKPKSARFDWDEDQTQVNVTFLAKGENKSTIALEHRRMASAAEAERMKNYWRARFAALKESWSDEHDSAT